MERKGGVTVIIGDNAKVETEYEYEEEDEGGSSCGGCGYDAEDWMEYCPACGDRMNSRGSERQEGKPCGRCGAECSSDARYCPMCGAQLPEDEDAQEEYDNEPDMVVICPTCGEGNPEGANFCHVCGSSLAGIPAVPDEGVEDNAVEQMGMTASRWKCVRCGMMNDSGSHRCKNCGRPHRRPGTQMAGGKPYEMASGSARYEMDGVTGDGWTCGKCGAKNPATASKCVKCGFARPFGAKALFGAAITSALSEVAQRGARPDVRKGDYVSWYVDGTRGQGIVERVHRRGTRPTVGGFSEASIVNPVLYVKAHGLNEDASWHDLRRSVYVRSADVRLVDQMWLSNRAKV